MVKNGNKLIDYDLTIKDFFKSASDYLTLQKQKAKDKKEYEIIIKNIEIINVLAQDPKRWADYSVRVKAKLEPNADAFIRKNSAGMDGDNSAWLAFSQVLFAIDEYYNTRYSVWDKENNILKAIKKWKYAISTSWLKDFIFPFKSVESFATRVSVGNKKER